MKTKIYIFALAMSICITKATLAANMSIEAKPRGWLSSTDLLIREDGVYMRTNIGVFKMKVFEYDQENDRYLVECISFNGETPYPTPAASDDKESNQATSSEEVIQVRM